MKIIEHIGKEVRLSELYPECVDDPRLIGQKVYRVKGIWKLNLLDILRVIFCGYNIRVCTNYNNDIKTMRLDLVGNKK